MRMGDAWFVISTNMTVESFWRGQYIAIGVLIIISPLELSRCREVQVIMII